VIIRTATTVVGNAFLWAVLVGSAFIGIGGMSAEGAGASNVEIQHLWQGDAILTGLTFLVALIIFAMRKDPDRNG
jgi:hypothetical protein